MNGNPPSFIRQGSIMFGKRLFFISLLLFIILIFNKTPIDAGDSIISEEGQKCLGCHARQGIIIKFKNNESIHAYLDEEKFKASVHNFLTCSDCHTDFSDDKHPERKFWSKEQYKIRSSLVCKQCHSEKQIKVQSIHRQFLNEEGGGISHPCTNCHGAHSTARMKAENALTNEEGYCLGCHGHALGMIFKNGEILSLKIDHSLLKTSTHNKLSCSDCHFGFSRSQHPKRNFKSARDFSIAHSESCRRCHFDKYIKSLESIHNTILSQGNLSAPVCTDCHGSHFVQYVSKERAASASKCKKCHFGIYTTYAGSVHGNALINENNQDVPVCIDCHKAHNIVDPRTFDYREKIPQMCGNCHANKAIVGKYGLSTDVVRSYLSDFHGITLGFYKKQKDAIARSVKPLAVCTDCHGTHNITSTTGPDSTILKANLVKRCQKCHKDARENFPDSWLSHYKPSLKNATFVYVVNAVYTILIPLMLFGLVLQIMLHIWRYAVNR